MKKISKLITIVLILVLAFTLRLYKITNPIADWHSFRQADTASVTREFVKQGINLWVPRYHDLSNIQSGKDNLSGYRMVEFPIINAGTALVIKVFGQSHEILIGRLVSVFFSLLSIIALYYIGKKLSGEITALSAAFIFAVLPYSVYYSRVILPEPAFLALICLSLAFFISFLTRKSTPSFLLFFCCLTLALLLKPFALFLFPVFISVAYYFHGKKIVNDWPIFIFLILALVPLYFWRHWILNFPTGIPASDWLYNKDNIRFKGAFFHWLFEVRLSTLILGIGGLVPTVLGLIKRGSDHFVYLIWTLCLLAYSIIFAGGNVQHDYYQIIWLPLLCLLAGRGVQLLFMVPSTILNKHITTLTLVTLLIFSIFVSWYTVRGYYQINNPAIIFAGQAVDKLTPQDAKIIAPYNGDTAFLFQTNRIGWPLGYYIDDKIKQGASYYVSVSYDDEARLLETKYAVVEKNKDYILINLSQPK